jgi:hypothetical protein
MLRSSWASTYAQGVSRFEKIVDKSASSMDWKIRQATRLGGVFFKTEDLDKTIAA